MRPRTVSAEHAVQSSSAAWRVRGIPVQIVQEEFFLWVVFRRLLVRGTDMGARACQSFRDHSLIAHHQHMRIHGSDVKTRDRHLEVSTVSLCPLELKLLTLPPDEARLSGLAGLSRLPSLLRTRQCIAKAVMSSTMSSLDMTPTSAASLTHSW